MVFNKLHLMLHSKLEVSLVNTIKNSWLIIFTEQAHNPPSGTVRAGIVAPVEGIDMYGRS